jgi:hypothetical protein
MVRRMAAEVPAEFLAGVVEVTVSPKMLPHPTRGEVYTLGECIPIPGEGEAGPVGIQSRVVLYHGSFRALAAHAEEFDWRTEAWETLTHELRHHLEWRARAPDLEAFDWAAEQNFARGDGDPFDPLFYRSGELVVEGVYRIDDDYFVEQTVRHLPARLTLQWHGRRYAGIPPAGLGLPAFLTIEGVEDPPPGDLVVVLRRRPGLLRLFRRELACQAEVAVEPAR